MSWLKQQGYQVICIDRERVHGTGIAFTHIPHGAEDETGERPLAERSRWMRHAAAFIGCLSGLAGLGSALPGCDDLRLYAPQQRVRDARQGGELACLQLLLERCAGTL